MNTTAPPAEWTPVESLAAQMGISRHLLVTSVATKALAVDLRFFGRRMYARTAPNPQPGTIHAKLQPHL